MTRPGKILLQAGFEPWIFRSQGGHLNHQANETVTQHSLGILSHRNTDDQVFPCIHDNKVVSYQQTLDLSLSLPSLSPLLPLPYKQFKCKRDKGYIPLSAKAEGTRTGTLGYCIRLLPLMRRQPNAILRLHRVVVSFMVHSSLIPAMICDTGHYNKKCKKTNKKQVMRCTVYILGKNDAQVCVCVCVCVYAQCECTCHSFTRSFSSTLVLHGLVSCPTAFCNIFFPIFT